MGPTDGTGCTAPVANAASSGPYSEGTIIVLSTDAMDGATYQWTGPAGFASSLQNPMISGASVANAGTYTVAVTNGCGTANATTNVTVYPRPTISIDDVVAKASARGAKGTFTFHVTLSNPSSTPVSAGRDYVTTVNTLLFEPGTTEH